MPANAAAAATSGSAPNSSDASRIVFIGHLPHGFFENQLKEYFGQFGKINMVRVSRSKKTTKSRGFGYLQFSHAEVAKIAADAMDGYMMFGQTIKCHVLKGSEVHPDLFKNAKRKMKRKPWQKIEAERHNKDRTPDEQRKRVERLIKKDTKRAARIKATGMDYDYESLQSVLPSASKKTLF